MGSGLRIKSVHLAIVLLVLANAYIWGAALRTGAGDLLITVLDVGQGDCSLVVTPGGRTVLIDGGGRHGHPDAAVEVGRRTVEPTLRQLGINRIDIMVSTHPDEDHLGGLVFVLEHMRVGEIVEGGDYGEGESVVYDRFVKAARERGVPRRVVCDGYRIDFGDGVIAAVLNPPEIPLSGTEADDNNNSVVLRFSFGIREFLFTGDAEWMAEEVMLRHYPRIRSGFLKVGHHGGPGASSWAWLKAVHPEVAVISCGRNNPYGHPSQAVLRRLWTVGADVYRTDRHGAVTVRSNGQNMRVTTTRPLPPEFN
jgi:competence protein ComEC